MEKEKEKEDFCSLLILSYLTIAFCVICGFSWFDWLYFNQSNELDTILKDNNELHIKLLETTCQNMKIKEFIVETFERIFESRIPEEFQTWRTFDCTCKDYLKIFIDKDSKIKMNATELVSKVSEFLENTEFCDDIM